MHSTTPSACERILSSEEPTWKGTIPDTEAYDGFDKLDAASELRARSHFELRPSSDGVMFTFSRYPKAVSPASAIRIMSVNARILSSPEYELFYVATTPTQFRASFNTVYHSHVVAALKGTPHEAYAAGYFTRLDKDSNFNENGHVGIASQVYINGRKYPHVVHLSFLGGLKLSARGEVKILDCTRLANPGDKVTCPELECSFSHSSLSMLKSHYLAKHTTLKLFTCEDCNASFAWKKALASHMDVHLEREMACLKCGKAYRRKQDLLYHVLAAHHPEKLPAKPRPEGPYCDQCDSKFKTHEDLNAHLSSVHLNTE